MKKLLLILLIASANISKGQNIVPNPSFEMLDSICPLSYFIQYSYLWESANTATPDIFDTCMGIPQNNCGYQFAHTGKGMGGIVTKGPNNYREYLEIKLDSALKDAHDYCVEFWISMGEYSQLATYPPQVYFSDTLINSPLQTVLNFTPQFMDTTAIITDTANWIKISGNFNSLCNCQYMLIGNFYDDANTDTMQIQSSYLSAYYYIDDVVVTECNPAGVKEQNKSLSIYVYPNPANDIIAVSTGNEKIKSIGLSDVYGRVVYKAKNVNTHKQEINCGDLAPGTYFLQIQDGFDKVYTKRVIVSH